AAPLVRCRSRRARARTRRVRPAPPIRPVPAPPPPRPRAVRVRSVSSVSARSTQSSSSSDARPNAACGERRSGLVPSAPEVGTPVVQLGAIFGPWGAVVRSFEVVAVVDGTPGGVERFFGGGGPHATGEAFFDGAETCAVLLSLPERDRVRKAGEVGPAQLL